MSLIIDVGKPFHFWTCMLKKFKTINFIMISLEKAVLTNHIASAQVGLDKGMSTCWILEAIHTRWSTLKFKYPSGCVRTWNFSSDSC